MSRMKLKRFNFTVDKLSLRISSFTSIQDEVIKFLNLINPYILLIYTNDTLLNSLKIFSDLNSHNIDLSS